MYMGLTQFLVYAEPSIINMRVATHCRICLSLSFSLSLISFYIVSYNFQNDVVLEGQHRDSTRKDSREARSVFWVKKKCGSLLRKDV